MSSDFNNWREKPEEGASSADREGFNNNYRKSYNGGERNYNNGERNYNNGERSFNRERSDRPYGDRPYGNRSYGNRPYGNRNFNNNGERSFNNNGERSFNRSEGENGERPRRPYNNNGYGNRSYGNRNYNNGERSFNRNEGENGERPRRTFNNNGYGNRSYGNRNFNNGERSYGNRSFNNGERNFENNGEGFNRRPRFAAEPEKPQGFRADGRPRRPRINKAAAAASNTEWLAENDFKAPKFAPNLDPTKPIRLNKFLSNAGVCSRREADEFIQAGVVKVNGEVVSELGVKVMPSDEIMFHDQPVKIERKVYILLNKPKDCVTTSEDPQERLTVMDIVKNACYERIYPVGRLDRNTTGVLLLTNDGDLASKLAHPKYEKRKIYQATLDKDLTEEDLAEIAKGVELEGEMVAVDEISYVNDRKNVIGIEIHSGQNRVVRRIFEKFNYKVYRLDRVYFAGLTKKNLPRGKWRHLTEREVSQLKMGIFS